MTMTEVKEWSIGKGKTAVHLSWMSDSPYLVKSDTVSPQELTDKQCDAQTERIRREIKRVFGWAAESGNSDFYDDREIHGWWKVGMQGRTA